MSRLTPLLLRNTLTLLLAGGQGERLFPLTKDRSKPSVPYAGCYRIADFSLSNCLNSGLRRIYVLTQFKSQSLDRHIRNGWSILNRELDEFIETVPPQRRITNRWYEGTADAIYQNVYLLEQTRPDCVLILSGDHIYRMDYFQLLEFHSQKGADVTIASYEYPLDQSSSFGVIHVDKNDRVVRFVEKPADPPPIPGKPDTSLVNMGVYVFDTATLVRAVIDDAKRSDSEHDLGKNIFPRLLENGNAAIYSYPLSRQDPNPYWRDVGGIASYYEATMDLLDSEISIRLFSPDWPLRTDALQQNPIRLNLENHDDIRIDQSIISAGCHIEGSLSRCVLSPRVSVQRGSRLVGCVVFNDTQIGKRCRIRNAIIDKKVVIPDDCVIGYDPVSDRKQFLVSEENIVVIPKGLIVEPTASTTA